jgi:nonsense-mediated mRNA decay protein 3
MVELAPVCREDLVILPTNLAKDLGGIGPMVLVYKISKFIHIVDIHTMQTYEVDPTTYWKNPFKAALGRERLTEFVVLDIENVDTNMNDSRAAIKQRFRLVRLTVARGTDFGKNDRVYIVNCHLGETLDYNDTVLAYDLE